MSRWAGARRRLGSIRLSLILLALVPGITLASVWGMTTVQILSEGLRLRSQTELSRSTGALGTEAMLALQRERKLSALKLASPRTSTAALDEQREATDVAVAKLTARSDLVADAPERTAVSLLTFLNALGDLQATRDRVDDPGSGAREDILTGYDRMVDAQIQAFQNLSQVDDGELTAQASPLFPLEQAAELLAREDARLTLAWPSGHFQESAWQDFAKFTHTRRWLLEDQLVPLMAGGRVRGLETEQGLKSTPWRTLRTIEDQVLAAHTPDDGGRVALPRGQKRWNAAVAEISGQYQVAIQKHTTALLDSSAERARELLLTAAALSIGGLIAVLLCVGLSWRITRSLSRRLHGLRMATLNLAEHRLPEVVARLERGEKVDTEAAVTPLDHGDDELGQVAQAFNTAQRTAVRTAVELAQTRSGFQKVILGIARQSQNLVNRQLGRLDALERRHSDPELLAELYELDSIASQLRRYEENLVVVSGERPGRSWSRPVAVTDIVHSAIGEVSEYQRVRTHTEEDVALAPPAVADVIHLLAELIDNATAYSPAPSPVTVRAALVARGLALEIEDQGLGLSEDDYAALNTQLAHPVKFDVVGLAEDLRLGMFVISHLAHRHGITVTLRRSPYGGTTSVVLIPHGIVVRDTPAPGTTTAGPATAGAGRPGRTESDAAPSADSPADSPAASAPPPAADGSAPAADGRAAATGPAPATDTPATDAPAAAVARPDSVPADAAAPASVPGAVARPRLWEGGPAPLPRRVPQTSLAAELRVGAAAADTAGEPGAEAGDGTAEFSAEDASASLAGFQRGTLRARDSAAQQ
ncbi:nitrate- and nitrite sensing domain-containing protein [Streptomyces sp. NPDC007929]|uniref:sensor histidine kinase n=1 Tax=unclassified Streptomyces TaxID=2593676 RepID=UPI0036DFB19D